MFRFVSSSQVIFFLPINFWYVLNYLRLSPVVETVLFFCKMSICRLIRQAICRYTLVFVNSQWETEKCLHTSLHTSHVNGGICIVNIVSFSRERWVKSYFFVANETKLLKIYKVRLVAIVLLPFAKSLQGLRESFMVTLTIFSRKFWLIHQSKNLTCFQNKQL